MYFKYALYIWFAHAHLFDFYFCAIKHLAETRISQANPDCKLIEHGTQLTSKYSSSCARLSELGMKSDKIE